MSRSRKRSPETEIRRLRWTLHQAREALRALRDPATSNETRIHLVKNALYFADQELRPRRSPRAARRDAR